jgi:hypothetical protein
LRASSKLLLEVALISETLATDISPPLSCPPGRSMRAAQVPATGLEQEICREADPVIQNACGGRGVRLSSAARHRPSRFLHSAVDELFSRAVASFELRAKLELSLISEAGKIELELGPSF